MSDVACWFVLQGGKESGPFASSQLKDMVKSGMLKPLDLVWKEGFADWVQAGRVKGLFEKAKSADVGEVVSSGASRKVRIVRSSPTGQAPGQTPRTAPSQAPRTAPVQAPAKPKADAWFVYTPDGETYGPIPKAELDMWVQQRRVGRGAQVLREGEKNWAPLESLFPHLVSQPGSQSGMQSSQASGQPIGHHGRRREQRNQRLLNLPFALKCSGWIMMIGHVGMGIINLVMFLIGMSVFLELAGTRQLEPKILVLFISSAAIAVALQIVLFRMGYGLIRGKRQAINGCVVMFVVSAVVVVFWVTGSDSFTVRTASFLFISPLINLIPEVVVLSMLGAYALFLCLPPVLVAKGSWEKLR